MVELKDCQQQEMESKLQFHSRLTLMEHMFTSLKVCNLKVRMQGTYCISFQTQQKFISPSDDFQNGRSCMVVALVLVVIQGLSFIPFFPCLRVVQRLPWRSSPLQPPKGEKNTKNIAPRKFLCVISGSNAQHSCPYSTGQNSHGPPHAREGGNCSLTVCLRGRGNGFGEQLVNFCHSSAQAYFRLSIDGQTFKIYTIKRAHLCIKLFILVDMVLHSILQVILTIILYE